MRSNRESPNLVCAETAAKFDGRPFTIKIAAGNWYPCRVKTSFLVSAPFSAIVGPSIRIFLAEFDGERLVNPASPLFRLAAVVNSVLLKFVLEEARPLPTQRWSTFCRWLFRSFLSDATPTNLTRTRARIASRRRGKQGCIFSDRDGLFRRSLARGSTTW